MTGEETDQFKGDFAAAKEMTQRLSQSLPESIEVAALGGSLQSPLSTPCGAGGFNLAHRRAGS